MVAMRGEIRTPPEVDQLTDANQRPWTGRRQQDGGVLCVCRTTIGGGMRSWEGQCWPCETQGAKSITPVSGHHTCHTDPLRPPRDPPPTDVTPSSRDGLSLRRVSWCLFCVTSSFPYTHQGTRLQKGH